MLMHLYPGRAEPAIALSRGGHEPLEARGVPRARTPAASGQYPLEHGGRAGGTHLPPSPLVSAVFRAAGAITDEELLSFRRLGSRLDGHPTPILPWVDVATGSL